MSTTPKRRVIFVAGGVGVGKSSFINRYKSVDEPPVKVSHRVCADGTLIEDMKLVRTSGNDFLIDVPGLNTSTQEGMNFRIHQFLKEKGIVDVAFVLLGYNGLRVTDVVNNAESLMKMVTNSNSSLKCSFLFREPMNGEDAGTPWGTTAATAQELLQDYPSSNVLTPDDILHGNWMARLYFLPVHNGGANSTTSSVHPPGEDRSRAKLEGTLTDQVLKMLSLKRNNQDKFNFLATRGDLQHKLKQFILLQKQSVSFTDAGARLEVMKTGAAQVAAMEAILRKNDKAWKTYQKETDGWNVESKADLFEAAYVVVDSMDRGYFVNQA